LRKKATIKEIVFGAPIIKTTYTVSKLGCKKCQYVLNMQWAHTIKAAYTIEPGVTFFILFNSAWGRLVFALFGADRSSLADVGAVNMCLKN
jgi:hypothetical protein